MKLAELERELGKGRVRPAYLLAGEEPLLRDDALALIRNAVLAGKSDDFNLDRLSGDKTTPGQLRQSLRALPVLADRRLVVLAEPESRRGGGGELVRSVTEAIAELASQDRTVLVVAAAKVDKRTRWVKAFSEPSALVACDPPRAGRETIAFVRREADRQGIGLAPGVEELLAERIGPQLLMLRQEIAKLALFVEPGEAVSREQAATSSAPVADESIWDLVDAIGTGRRADALVLLSRLLDGGAAPPPLLGALASHFRKLTQVRSGGRISLKPFVRKKLERQAQRYTSARLLGCLQSIHEADTAMKGASALPPGRVLEQLVIGLAR